MAEIDKSTMMEDIWNNFMNRIQDNVTTVTISISPNTVTIQTYVSDFSEEIIDNKDNYPILVVSPPILSGEQFTMGITEITGSIDIEIYTNQAQSADKFLSKIIDTIETGKGALRAFDIRMIELESTESDRVKRGNLNIHMRRARFSFRYHHFRSKSY